MSQSAAPSPVAPAVATCPECDAPVRLFRAPMCGQVCTCPGCAVELEVVGIEPLTLAPAPEVEEDWGE